jgi:hypothetical protein
MQLFANDREGKFPWMISTNRDGSLELTNSGMVFRHFSAASNELVSAKGLSCFISLDTQRHQTSQVPSILAGDRNIRGGTALSSSVGIVRKSDKLVWSKEIHRKAGNVGLVDGSVLQVDDVGLNNAVAAMTNAAIRLAIP